MRLSDISVSLSLNNKMKITTIRYHDLENNNTKELSTQIQNSLQQYGIILISNIPKFPTLKQSLLPMAYNLARCTSKEYLEEELTDEKVK